MTRSIERRPSVWFGGGSGTGVVPIGMQDVAYLGGRPAWTAQSRRATSLRYVGSNGRSTGSHDHFDGNQGTGRRSTPRSI